MARSHANHAKAHLPWGDDPIGRAVYHIKVSGDEGTPGATALAAGDAQFVFLVPWDNGDYYLSSVQTYVTTVSSSGDPTVMIRNMTTSTDMLTTAASIDAGDFSVGTSAVIDRPNAKVTFRQRIAVDVTAAGTGAWGLGVILEFGWGLQI